MNADKELKDILHMAVKNAVSKMKILRSPGDRRCLFHEYKEWLGESIDDEVPVSYTHLTLPTKA